MPGKTLIEGERSDSPACVMAIWTYNQKEQRRAVLDNLIIRVLKPKVDQEQQRLQVDIAIRTMTGMELEL